eukprot:11165113-Lingulodinium_polyedra.AAC.1
MEWGSWVVRRQLYGTISCGLGLVVALVHVARRATGCCGGCCRGAPVWQRRLGVGARSALAAVR